MNRNEGQPDDLVGLDEITAVKFDVTVLTMD